ncbi:MAG TPA: sarcosine oxidase subunit gamma family protein [Burkholderiales bacterium]|nr:sarcosine oxidase subunit gamma family protein [Burkholderiales bacterium]
MPDEIRLESPLVRRRLKGAGESGAGIVATERPFLGHINLRGEPADARFASAVERVLGVALPMTPNTVAIGRDGVVYWLGPDEWLLVTPGEREGPIASTLRDALGDVFSSVTEIGSGQTLIVLQGPMVRDLLAKECPFDLSAPSFALGTCAQTRLAKAAVLLRPLEDGAIELIVRRSFADYLWTWLADATAE